MRSAVAMEPLLFVTEGARNWSKKFFPPTGTYTVGPGSKKQEFKPHANTR